jgi:hypothetical protein
MGLLLTVKLTFSGGTWLKARSNRQSRQSGLDRVARQVMEQIVQSGRLQRGGIGVSLHDLFAAEGIIAEVAAASPAECAGIRKGDIVVEADDVPSEAPLSCGVRLVLRRWEGPFGSPSNATGPRGI